jgi:hypothetical protein
MLEKDTTLNWVFIGVWGVLLGAGIQNGLLGHSILCVLWLAYTIDDMIRLRDSGPIIVTDRYRSFMISLILALLWVALMAVRYF